MAKVICTLPNASDSINGVKFELLPDGAGRVSEEISDAAAAAFSEIPGYEIDGLVPTGKNDGGNAGAGGSEDAVVKKASDGLNVKQLKDALTAKKIAIPHGADKAALAALLDDDPSEADAPVEPAAAPAPGGNGSEYDETVF